MFSRLQKLFSSKAARDRRRSLPAAVRIRHFERLESRSLLSANLGTMHFDVHEHAFGGSSFAEPPRWHDGVYAPPPQQASFNGAMPPMFGSRHEDFDAFQHSSPYENYGDGPGAWSLGGPTGGPRNLQTGAPSDSMSKPAAAAAMPSQTIYIMVVMDGPVYFGSYSASSTVNGQQPTQARFALPLMSASPATKSTGEHLTNPNGSSGAIVADKLPISPAVAAIPSAAQISGRSSDRISILPSSAIDAAIQSYTSRLLLAANGGSDRFAAANAAAIAEQSDSSVDDFIELESSTRQSTTDDSVGAADGATDTIDALLERLQDLDTISWELNPAPDANSVRGVHDSSFEDLPLPLAVANIALANAEGGMAMIEVSDYLANEIDFASISNTVASQPSAPAAEAAVGFYQAIEVGGEVAPSNIQAAASPRIPSAGQAEPENRYSVEEQRGTAKKAATSAAVSALVGALVWCARRKQCEEK